MGRQTKSNSKVLDLVLGEDSFPPVIPQIMLTTKFLVYNCVARELFVSNSSIQCHVPKPESAFERVVRKVQFERLKRLGVTSTPAGLRDM